ELRVRIERLLDTGRYPAAQARRLAGGAAINEDMPAYKLEPFASGPSGGSHPNVLALSAMEIDAYAEASASRCATTKESFRAAKSHVIARFERAYIIAALGRHSGNIAMAAR